MRRDRSGLLIGGSEVLRLAVTKMLLDIIFEAAVISAFSPMIGGDCVRAEKPPDEGRAGPLHKMRWSSRPKFV